ncbi:hypothetical protein HYU17_01035 [Candidatus Woesearchaeota archaeon]|nr:hypothetical protein [Candidatus Woesearchaeota archaeon]
MEIGKKAGKGKVWHSGIDDDSLDVLVVEIEDLENDELSPEEAGFMYGYSADEAWDEELEGTESDEWA